jgi:hypothetical protein
MLSMTTAIAARKLRFRTMSSIVVFTLVMCKGAPAQQNGCTERTIPLTIRTTNGSPGISLSTADLEGSYLGKAVQIGSFVSAKTKPRVVYLVEISEDMQRTGALENWNFPLDLARSLILRTPSDVEVGIAFFTNRLQHAIAPTTDRNKLVTEVETVRSLRGDVPHEVSDPPLWDIIRGATDLLAPAQVGDAVYAIVHGGEYGSKASAQVATVALASAGIRLFAALRTFQPGGPYGTFPITLTDSQTQLLQIVEETGGIQVDLPKGSGLSIGKDPGRTKTSFVPFDTFLEEQFRSLFRVYPLIINLPQPVDKPRQLRLDLRSKKDGVRLIYPKTLFPCT